TLLEKLRMAWSGEDLTSAWVDKIKHVRIPRHSYRLGVVVGVQPLRAATLLDASDAGTPQRFVWMPMTNPGAPDQEPPAPNRLDLKTIDSGWQSSGGVCEITLPPEAVAFVKANRRKVLRGQSQAANKHLTLCRIKVAAALAVLHNSREITPRFWKLS